jgi:hypothetical protein
MVRFKMDIARVFKDYMELAVIGVLIHKINALIEIMRL